MTYNYDKEVDVSFDFDDKALFELVAETVLDHEKCPYEAEVSLLLCDNDSIQKINKDMRNLNVATDVLSFPMNDYDVPADFSDLEDNPDAFDPDSGEILLGDIVISADKIKSQAADFGHSEKREFAFLIVHSMLHLIGFDHIEESDRIVMESLQDEIMIKLNIPR